MAAAAVIGASGGAAAVDAGYNVQTGQRQFAPPVRTAAPTTSYSVNPLLSGASAMGAPSIGRSGSAGRISPTSVSPMPGAAPRPISAAGGGSAALGAVLPLALAGGLGALKGQNPIDAIKGALPLNPFSAEAAKEYAEGSERAAANRQGIGNALNAIGDALRDRFKGQRKGDTRPPRTKAPESDVLEGSRATLYQVTFDATSINRGLEVFNFMGPISGVSSYLEEGGSGYGHYVVNHAGGVFDSRIFMGYDQTSAPKGSIRAIDGSPDPVVPKPPIDFDANGSPLLTGLTPTPTNGTIPTLPSAQSRIPDPASATTPANRLPATQAPRDSFENPSRPAQSNPTKGDEKPSSPANPAPISPKIPTMPALPAGIPTAPQNGSASLKAPAFPSSFTEIPGTRNPESLQPLKPSPSQPAKPMGCADPCISTLQGLQGNALDALQGLADLLSSLIASFQQQGEEQNQINKLITVSVPVAVCNLDGTAEIEYIDLSVPPLMANSISEQFISLAAIHSIQCKLERNVERSLNILGGDEWFEEEDDRTPEFATKVERKIKEAGTLFGFPAIAAETPAPTGSTGDSGAQPVAGQLKAKNLIELINAYTSNLYHRAGYQGLPATVPKTLLGYTDGAEPESIKDFASYFVWYVKQFDALVGKFPINITIEDVDPLTQGNQVREVELPNISEALAEMFGINIATSVNADVTVNFLMRLASELVATKNASLITQDYVRANAAFLGYKGNPVKREINYAFNPTKLDTLEEFLKDSKASIVGWEEDDSESVVGFLQRIVFSAGIIKSVFFRDKRRLAELQKEIENMMKGDKDVSEAEWEAFLLLLNNPAEYFNQDSIPNPRVKERPAPQPPESTQGGPA